jgi:DNA processing protein
MPFYIPQTIENQAICYFTVMHLNKYSIKQAMDIYNAIDDFSDWTYKLTEYFFLDKNIVQNAKDFVLNSIDSLEDYDLIAQKGKHLYPKRLAKINDAPEFLFLRGEASLTDRTVISIVGTRNPSDEGFERARRLARLLSERNITVASGLAKGIDFAAHNGTFDVNKPTIAVIGTPLNNVYPKEHNDLQNAIGQNGLVISQFIPGSPIQKWNFPMRNATMSGISVATIVIEAGETSGALIQAREALKQGRRVFIPQSALDNPALRWPKNYLQKPGADKFATINELMSKLQNDDLIEGLIDATTSHTLTFSSR